MALILLIETATKVCSVGLSRNGVLIGAKEHEEEGYSHSEKLNPFIMDILKEFDVSMNEIDAIAISEGPGSYTGLRIGTSTAKGLCYALDIPLISVNTLESLNFLAKPSVGYRIPMIDARRMEVFMSVYKGENLTQKQSNQIIDENFFNDYNEKVSLFGSGAEKLVQLFEANDNIEIQEGVVCSVKGMVQIAEHKYENKAFVDTAYFEPNYGKEFYTTAKKLELNK